MQGYTRDKSMAVHCAAQLRAKGVFAEVMSSNEGKFYVRHEVWVKDANGRQFQVDLDAAFAGRVVEFQS